MTEKDIRQYWDFYIEDWEKSTYGFNYANIFNRISFYLRKPLRLRMKLALELLLPHISDANILELGCGTGIFCEKLFNFGAKSITGVDISLIAIQHAEDRIKNMSDLSNSKKYKFICDNILNVDFSGFDIVIGLGILDWLSPDAIEALPNKLKDKSFLLSFSEKKFSLYNMLHRLYWQWRKRIMKIKVKPYYYSIDYIRKIFSSTPIQHIKNRQMPLGIFVHNLPI